MSVHFQAHSMWTEMNLVQHWHKLPYTAQSHSGIIDVLYQHGDAWTIADFKTREIRHADQLAGLIAEEKYYKQVGKWSCTST